MLNCTAVSVWCVCALYTPEMCLHGFLRTDISALMSRFLHTSHCLLHDGFSCKHYKITFVLFWFVFDVILLSVLNNFHINHVVCKLQQTCLWTWTAWTVDKCHISEVTNLHINAQTNKNKYLIVYYDVMEERCLKRVWYFLAVFTALNMCSYFWITACFAVCDCLLISWLYSVTNLCLLICKHQFYAPLFYSIIYSVCDI